MSPKPTILLIHGAWHTPAHYEPYTTALQNAGFEVHCPHLPTCTGQSPPTATFADDVALIRQTLHSLTSAGKQILLIMHSYGGCVGTDAAQDFLHPSPNNKNQPPKGGQGSIIHLLYLCAYILPPGSSIQTIMDQAGVDETLWAQFMDDDEAGLTLPRDPGLWFYEDLEPETVQRCMQGLVRFPVSVLREKTSGDAWRRCPVTYVKTERDRAVPGLFQDLMLDAVKKEGVEIRVLGFEACHSVFLENVGGLVGVVRDIEAGVC
ncbi:Alpha/beta hydrolase fold-1 [Aspergillus pseudonomiae]|uniref:Alpha/beta hydrolase fold-1 n=1 Tax=Aspergillus pseudonomiae TaxID=1506151 RepID=A0A5N7DUH7_9EURO|nr:Alpha/beta hydrolase fold-1 [Aspergillus pseudonomiae]KAB8261328.1 Alpha/beta hydrolase fold-1 [Aspergillus pseudonomiae]KAE8410064.1 Alpha/beta hydrolase fold-1 [Aspergillus pseudonomiae]